MADILIGMDEAGMGCIAGPMTAAIVVIRADRIPKGVRDSKKLTEARREEFADLIMNAAEHFEVVSVGPEEIDRYGLSWCWLGAIKQLAIKTHILRAPEEAEYILDGNRLVELRYVKPVVKADATYPAVSAASILAKYVQCGWMDDYHEMYPGYGFDAHRGYGTVKHLQKLKELGPCPIHRKSFKPVKRVL